ncbi:hypothetical protein Tco_1350338, partial [Tanacetum coccineum]
VVAIGILYDDDDDDDVSKSWDFLAGDGNAVIIMKGFPPCLRSEMTK